MASHLRRSSRLNATTSPDKKASIVSTTGGHSSVASPMSLSPELRLLIYSSLVIAQRPYFIGCCQDKWKNGGIRKHEGSPRDIFTFHPHKFRFFRGDQMYHSSQPAVTRVCRQLRQEALPVFYRENEFWLIHNEFEPDDETQRDRRGYHPWLQHTPRPMFQHLQRGSLCGYGDWSNRKKIDLLLKDRRVISVRNYSIYGKEMPISNSERMDELKQWFASEESEDAFATLNGLLKECDWKFQIPKERTDAPPGMLRGVPPAEGLEHDF